MINIKTNNFQCLIFFYILNLFFVSFSYAEEVVVQEIISLKEGDMTPKLATRPILSKEQLLQCHEKTVLANQTVKKLNEQFNILERHKKNLDGQRQKLEMKKTQLDLHSQNSVNEYNLANDELNLLTQNYSLEAENYNKLVKHYKSDIEILKSECGGKRYIQNNETPIISQ